MAPVNGALGFENCREGKVVSDFFGVLDSGRGSSVQKRRFVFCFTVLLAVFLVSCALPLKRPEVGLASVELVSLGRVEQRFMLRLNVRNSNEVDIQLNALDFDLEFNGVPFAKGNAEKAVLIPRQGESVLEVAAVSRLAQVLAVLRETQKQGQDRVGYRIVGYADVEGVGRLPFERRGEIAASALGRLMPR